MYKKYFTDNEGYKHEAEFDAQDRPIADRKYNGDVLVGEGIYEDGKFVGHKKYFTNNEGDKHESEFDAQDKPKDGGKRTVPFNFLLAKNTRTY